MGSCRCVRQCLGRERHWRGVLLKEESGRSVVLLEGAGVKKALFIGFNRFFILHMGVKRSTIRVSTLKEMKLCLR